MDLYWKIIGMNKLFSFFLIAGIAFFISACQKSQIARLEASPDAKFYELKGKVIAVNKSNKEITVAHDEVKDYMPAMTMPFKLKDDWVLNNLNAGDFISATLVVDKDTYWLEGIAITRTEKSAGNSVADTETNTPEQGNAVPNFQFVNQDEKRISLDDFKGKYLVLTFIYTRCPIPDYCPLMSNNFAAIHNKMLADKSLADKVRLLSITIDPKYDTPKVLRSYGASRGGRFDKEDFKLWEFATGKDNEIQQFAKFFGLYYVPDKDQIVHSLRTAIITPDGKIHKVIRGNQWKPDEVISDIQNLIKGNK